MIYKNCLLNVGVLHYRDSLQISMTEQEPLNARIVEGNNYSECTYAADRSAACCRSLALAVSII